MSGKEGCKAISEEIIVCGMICQCEMLAKKNPTKNSKRQSCVDGKLEAYLKVAQNSPIVPEAPFYVDQEKKIAVPLLTDKNQQVNWRRQIYLARMASDRIVPSSIDSEDLSICADPLSKLYADGKINAKEVNKRRKEAGEEKPVKYSELEGKLRKPDVVVLKDPDAGFEPDNIKQVFEIKFPPDTWGDGQQDAYKIIAGGEDNLKRLGPKECNCKDKKEEEKAQEQAQTQVQAPFESIPSIGVDSSNGQVNVRSKGPIIAGVGAEAAALTIGSGAVLGAGAIGGLASAGGGVVAGTSTTVLEGVSVGTATSVGSTAAGGVTYGNAAGILGVLFGGQKAVNTLQNNSQSQK